MSAGGGTIRIDPKNAMSFSAFGSDNSTFGGASAGSLLMGDRYQDLEYRRRYYDCTQHDGKPWDFEGRPISTQNPRTHQPLLGAERSWWVPLKMRRPSMTYRLGKIIVDSFTNLLFGEQRFPQIKVEGDEKTEDLLRTIARTGKLPLKMIEARTIGGASGTVGLSWCFRDGRPSFEVHDPKNLFVHQWKDRLELIPEHVSEVYLFSKVKWDGKGFNRQYYWFRRDWMPEADIVFEDAPLDPDPTHQITWVVDMERSNFHGDGCCHLEWIQNLPSDDADGLPDYDGLYESFDSLDLLMSVISTGAIRNLDPTVLLKMDRDFVNRMGVQKGSDNALVVGENGDAEYMELNGTSIEAGLKLIEMERRSILETAQCIVPDPKEVATQGVSSVTIKALFAPMLAKGDIIREQYGTAIERMFTKMSKVLRDKLNADVYIAPPDGPGADGGEGASESVEGVDEDQMNGGEAAASDPSSAPSAEPAPGEEAPADDEEEPDPAEASASAVPSASTSASQTGQKAKFVLNLPDKVGQAPLVDPLTGIDSGETIPRQSPREIGLGGEITLVWPPYFLPTPQDQSNIATALQIAAGGKPFLSQETAVSTAAKAYGADPSEEWKKVQKMAKDDAAKEASMGGDPGGQVGHPNQLPPGASPKPPHPAPPHPPAPGGGDDGAPAPAPGDESPADVDLTGPKKAPPPFGG